MKVSARIISVLSARAFTGRDGNQRVVRKLHLAWEETLQNGETKPQQIVADCFSEITDEVLNAFIVTGMTVNGSLNFDVEEHEDKRYNRIRFNIYHN